MIVAGLVVALYLISQWAGPVLARATWPSRRPATAVVLWVSLLAAMAVVLLTLTLMILAWPPGPLHRWFEHLRSCMPGHTHVGELAALAVAVVGGGWLLLAAWRGMTRVSRTVTERRRHHEMVQLIARYPDSPRDVCLIEHPFALIYCLPRRARPIVMTTGLLKQLDGAQVEAVLEHERCHLQHRHHLVLAVADAMRTALPWSATVKHAVTELSTLVEMVADDAAVRRCGVAPVVDALHRLTPVTGPTGSLGAGDESGRRMKQRIARLEAGRGQARHPGPRAVLLLSLATLSGVLLAAVALHLPC
ncbi:M56 family metallopeptidase [Nonomuraea africana]|nr:M56 family metallopeptidase [Nonomuraea africana]